MPLRSRAGSSRKAKVHSVGADDHRPGLGSRPQPGGDVYRQAVALAGADHDLTGRDPHSNRDLQIGDGIDDLQRRVHRVGGGVFIRHRESEVAHDAVVALMRIRHAAVPGDNALAPLVAARQREAVFLVTQRSYELGRIDEIV
jgi:hypothetical protein